MARSRSQRPDLQELCLQTPAFRVMLTTRYASHQFHAQHVSLRRTLVGTTDLCVLKAFTEAVEYGRSVPIVYESTGADVDHGWTVVTRERLNPKSVTHLSTYGLAYSYSFLQPLRRTTIIDMGHSAIDFEKA